jgi:hypothetical protein
MSFFSVGVFQAGHLGLYEECTCSILLYIYLLDVTNLQYPETLFSIPTQNTWTHPVDD